MAKKYDEIHITSNKGRHKIIHDNCTSDQHISQSFLRFVKRKRNRDLRYFIVTVIEVCILQKFEPCFGINHLKYEPDSRIFNFCSQSFLPTEGSRESKKSIVISFTSICKLSKDFFRILESCRKVAGP